MIFDGLSQQLPDIDPEETAEWIDSLDAVAGTRGKPRARFLVLKMLERARELQVGFPAMVSSDYINSIPPEREPWFPGDEDMERRIRAYIRWNAAVMVTRANTKAPGIGGHLATYASSAALNEVGFNHFFRGKDDGQPGDQVYFQGHAAPGIYARAFLERRLSEEQLDNFRQEIGGNGLSSYPHPRLMPDFWEFPTVSMGLGPINAIYQARFNRYLDAPPHRRHQPVAGVGLPRRRRVRRARDPRRPVDRGPGAPRQPDLRRELQPAAPRRPGSRERQDHPGAGGGLPGCGLERHQGHLGLEVGRAAGPRRRRRPPEQDEHHPRRPVPEVRGGERRLHPPRTSSAPTPACARWWSTSPTTSCAPCPAAATTTTSSTPPTGPPPSTSARPPPSWPRPSRAGRWAPRSRPATPPTRSRRCRRSCCTSSATGCTSRT